MFDPVGPAWRWDIDRIRARSYTENVADLMVEKMKRLSAPAQEAMKQLACLGNVANVATLTLVYEQTEDALHAGCGRRSTQASFCGRRAPTLFFTTGSSRRPIR